MRNRYNQYVGVDPGKTGAIAIINQDNSIKIHDMPLTPEDRIDGALLCNVLESTHLDSFCYIERSQAMPGQGIVSMFKYGVTYGIILAALQISTMAFQEIQPQKWKKEFNLIKKEKEESVNVAIQLFPEYKDLFQRANKHDPDKYIYLHGRADAILIAEYCRRTVK